MTPLVPMDLAWFAGEPWWLVLCKAVFAFVFLLVMTLFTIVFERKVVGKMQHRHGPTMNGPFGSLQSLADGMKLMFKEDFTPKAADKVVFMLAPFVIAIPAITAFAVIPMAGLVKIPFTDIETPLQVADTPVSVLIVLALASIGIYGIVLAGWSSGSTYPLLGALRSSAQMISYEIAMGLALVSVFLYAGSMSTSEIVAAQNVPATAELFGLTIPLPTWYAVVLIPAFIIYVISMVGETNRAPFDLPEAEGELVAGFATEYNAMRYAMFFMAEYMNMITVSALATTLFLGGWAAPLPFNLLGMDGGWWGLLWFSLKTLLFLFMYVWLRGSLPRFRYDQFMNLGWKYLIEIALAFVLVAGFIRLAQANEWFTLSSPVFWVVIGIFVLAILIFTFVGGKEEEEVEDEAEFDAFAGGYPVPPMGDQQLAELSRVIASTADTSDTGAADTGDSATEPPTPESEKTGADS